MQSTFNELPSLVGVIYRDSTNEVPVRGLPRWGQEKGEQTSLPQQGRGKIQREVGKKLTFSELLVGLRPFFRGFHTPSTALGDTGEV